MSLEGERVEEVLPLRRLAAFLLCLSTPPRREPGREGKAATYGWLAVFLIMSLSSVCWILNLITNDFSCAKWLLRVCKFGACCMLPSGEDLLPSLAVEGG